jgi:LmbE family N-acetylglucosaminyl deacetylase
MHPHTRPNLLTHRKQKTDDICRHMNHHICWEIFRSLWKTKQKFARLNLTFVQLTRFWMPKREWRKERDETLKFHTLAKCTPPPHDTVLYKVWGFIEETFPAHSDSKKTRWLVFQM